MKRGALLNLPNSISLSRLILALAFVLIDGRWERTILILAAGATDFLDGWLARIGNSSSVAGALIDPFADRVFVLSAVSTYLVSGLLSTAQYFIFLSRDIATAIGFVVARFIPGLTASAFQARLLGKTVTILQLITLIDRCSTSTARPCPSSRSSAVCQSCPSWITRLHFPARGPGPGNQYNELSLAAEIQNRRLRDRHCRWMHRRRGMPGAVRTSPFSDPADPRTAATSRAAAAAKPPDSIRKFA